MALTRSNKLWLMAILYMIVMVVLVAWLEIHFHRNKNSIKQSNQYETKK